MDNITVFQWLVLAFNITSVVLIWCFLLWNGWSFQVGKYGEFGFKIYSLPLKRFFNKKSKVPMNNEVHIKITGNPGSGKTRVIEILREALEKRGYHSIQLRPTSWAEDRFMISDAYHTIHIEGTNNTEEVQDA